MLSINYKDPRPIYEQIRDALRNLILSGAIGPGEKIPSVRELSSSLAISPNTIQRSYRELETLGLIYTVAGKGAFAANDGSAARRRQEELLGKLTGLVRELKNLGTGQEKVQEAVGSVYREEENHA